MNTSLPATLASTFLPSPSAAHTRLAGPVPLAGARSLQHESAGAGAGARAPDTPGAAPAGGQGSAGLRRRRLRSPEGRALAYDDPFSAPVPAEAPVGLLAALAPAAGLVIEVGVPGAVIFTVVQLHLDIVHRT